VVAIEQTRLIDEPTLSVAELCAGIGRALVRAYPDAVWVRGEIANKRALPKGHVFFDLVDPAGEATIPVVLWRADRMVVNRILRRSGHAVRVDDGTEVRIRAGVGLHRRQGAVRLRMLAIDTAYTLGRLAEARALLVDALGRDGSLARQQRIDLARVPLRVGLVTSASSAAAADFLETLGASGQAWRVALVDARVQGADAETSVVGGLVAAARAEVDVVCLVRGGGSRTDLATFDGEPVARAIAGCPQPVLTGIGHETDTTVADLVAHRSFKTPTACASFLVERVGGFTGAVDRAWLAIQSRAAAALDRSERRLDRATRRTQRAARHHLTAAGLRIDAAASRLDALDPARLLDRGWTITRHGDGRLVRRATDVATGDRLMTVFVDGEVASRVEEP
jgi:exodeoxyribonuclease VII large subunit